MPTTFTPESPIGQGGRRTWVQVASFGWIALAVTVAYIVFDRQPLIFDSYYHLLAGRSFATDGTLAVGEGSYSRAAWLSKIVGVLFRVFGEHVIVARMAMGAVTAVWATVLFAWVLRVANPAAAWVTGTLFALSPLVLVNAGFIRFYGVAGLLILIAVMSAYEATSSNTTGKRRALCALLMLGSLYALRYEMTNQTQIWALGLGAWLAATGAVAAMQMRRPLRHLILGTAVVGGGAALFIAWASGWLADTWMAYRDAQAGLAYRGSDLRFYERLIRDDYPTLWTLLPFAVLLSVRASPRLTGLALALFGVGFLSLSAAGPKAERYFVPLLPFFFLIWGLATAEAVPLLRSLVAGSLDRIGDVIRGPSMRRASTILAWGSMLLFLFTTNRGFSRLRTLPTGQVISRTLDQIPESAAASPAGWDAIAPTLREVMSTVDVVVTSNQLRCLYHVGDFDVAVRPAAIQDVIGRREFGIDPRTGRPVISSLESFQQVVDQHPTGVVFGEVWMWGHRVAGFSPEIVAWVEETMHPLELPGDVAVRAFIWGEIEAPSTPRTSPAS
jgi:hypothetical protein